MGNKKLQLSSDSMLSLENDDTLVKSQVLINSH